jgi:hypothetical protein
LDLPGHGSHGARTLSPFLSSPQPFLLFVKQFEHALKKNHISPNRKPVGRYDDKGILLESYTSTVEAGLKVGISSSTIAKVCRGVPSYKTAAGFILKFLGNQRLIS